MSGRVAAAGLALALLSTAGRSPASEVDLRWDPMAPRQGDLVLIEAVASPPVTVIGGALGAEALRFFPAGEGRWLAVAGIDLEAVPGPRAVHLEAVRDGQAVRRSGVVTVRARVFPTEHLRVPRPFVELDSETRRRVQEEAARLDALWATVSPGRFWSGPFLPPLADGVPAGFGRRRIINGEARNPHSGSDYRTARGTPVRAANAGLVALAADLFFAGRAVVLDHGLGLYTMYFHLEEFAVEPGQRVTRGQLIGTVGSSGRATGPHLHFGVRISGARVDPEGLVRAGTLANLP